MQRAVSLAPDRDVVPAIDCRQVDEDDVMRNLRGVTRDVTPTRHGATTSRPPTQHSYFHIRQMSASLTSRLISRESSSRLHERLELFRPFLNVGQE